MSKRVRVPREYLGRGNGGDETQVLLVVQLDDGGPREIRVPGDQETIELPAEVPAGAAIMALGPARTRPLLGRVTDADEVVLHDVVLDDPPTASAYPGLLGRPPGDRPNDVASGPGRQLPVDRVGRRMKARYLKVPQGLHAQGIAHGAMREFEITVEPLGWAIGDWIRTSIVPPGADSLSSSARAAVGKSLAETAHAVEELVSGASRDAAQTSREEATNSAQTTGETLGLQLGLGNQQSLKPGSAADALISSTTGALQLGFGAGLASNEAESQASIRRQFQDLVRSEVTQSWLARDLAHAGASGVVHDERLVHSFRNTTGHSLALAEYSVTRILLLTVCELSTRPVTFVPVTDAGKAFDARDVATHHDTLTRVLLDRSLQHCFSDARRDFVDSVIPSDAVVSRVKGTVQVTNPGAGDSHLQVDVLFGDERESHLVQRPDVGKHEFEIHLGRPLADCSGVELCYRNPGKFDLGDLGYKKEMGVGRIFLEGLVADSAFRWTLLDSGPHLLTDDQPVALSPSGPTSPVSSNTLLLLSHLDAHRSYYRLAIDLARDSGDRARLMLQGGGEDISWIPDDLEPVGFAGRHLAYLADGAVDIPRGDPILIQQFLSVPSPGVWAEIAHSEGRINEPTGEGPGWAQLPGSAEHGFPWPPPIDLEALGAPARRTTSGTVAHPEDSQPTQSDLSQGVAEAAAGADAAATQAGEAQAAASKTGEQAADATSEDRSDGDKSTTK